MSVSSLDSACKCSRLHWLNSGIQSSCVLSIRGKKFLALLSFHFLILYAAEHKATWACANEHNCPLPLPPFRSVFSLFFFVTDHAVEYWAAGKAGCTRPLVCIFAYSFRNQSKSFPSTIAPDRCLVRTSYVRGLASYSLPAKKLRRRHLAGHVWRFGLCIENRIWFAFDQRSHLHVCGACARMPYPRWTRNTNSKSTDCTVHTTHVALWISPKLMAQDEPQHQKMEERNVALWTQCMSQM